MKISSTCQDVLDELDVFTSILYLVCIVPAPVKRDTFDKVAQPLPSPCLFPPNMLWIMSLWFWQRTHASHHHPRHLPPELLLYKILFFSSSKSFRLEGKSGDSPFGDVHCIETFLPTKAVHKNYQKLEKTQVVHMCKYNHFCIFGCIGHVLEVKMIYYG
jgi:hypothetical protein